VQKEIKAVAFLVYNISNSQLSHFSNSHSEGDPPRVLLRKRSGYLTTFGFMKMIKF